MKQKIQHARIESKGPVTISAGQAQFDTLQITAPEVHIQVQDLVMHTFLKAFAAEQAKEAAELDKMRHDLKGAQTKGLVRAAVATAACALSAGTLAPLWYLQVCQQYSPRS